MSVANTSCTPACSPFQGKVCDRFGQGLILARIPCPPYRPLTAFRGRNDGHGLSSKNKPCPKGWQTLPG